MPWSNDAFAGFSTTEPWLPLSEDWPTRNVHRQSLDPGSMLNLYRSLLHLRRRHRSLTIGDLVLGQAIDEVLVYERRLRAPFSVGVRRESPDDWLELRAGGYEPYRERCRELIAASGVAVRDL